MRTIDFPGPVCPTVLVVEDEFIIGLFLRSVLEDAGFQVLGPAPSVQAALEILDDHRPHAAVLDINLRGELVTPVARKLENLGVPFVMSSAYAADAVMIDDVFAGAPMLEKPMHEQLLISSVCGIIGTASPTTV